MRSLEFFCLPNFKVPPGLIASRIIEASRKPKGAEKGEKKRDRPGWQSRDGKKKEEPKEKERVVPDWMKEI